MKMKNVVALTFGAVLVAALLGIAACGGITEVREALPEVFQPDSPYENYADSLRQASLDRTTLGQAWFRVGAQALANPADGDLPMREVVYFDPAEPAAFSWEFQLRRGQRLVARVITEQLASPSKPPPFLELFRVEAPNQAPAPVERSDDGRAIDWAVERNGMYILRLQVELLAGGRHEVTVEVAPGLTFPVSGKDSAAIGSRFGDPRDGGSRKHHGVDIFAPRGTHAVAADDGYISRVGTNNLGGNVVWMHTEGGLSLYYAHLERQLVRDGQRVRAGEPVGEVGNSGNARSTPTHLHFGVYENGPTDPWPYLWAPPGEPAPIEADLGILEARWGRVATSRMNFRSGPNTSTEILASLPRNTPVALEGVRGQWYRARLADGTQGWAHGNLVEAADRPVRRLTLPRAEVLRHSPAYTSPTVAAVAQGAVVEVLAEEEGGDLYVEDPGSSRRGWMSR